MWDEPRLLREMQSGRRPKLIGSRVAWLAGSMQLRSDQPNFTVVAKWPPCAEGCRSS